MELAVSCIFENHDTQTSKYILQNQKKKCFFVKKIVIPIFFFYKHYCPRVHDDSEKWKLFVAHKDKKQIVRYKRDHITHGRDKEQEEDMIAMEKGCVLPFGTPRFGRQSYPVEPSVRFAARPAPGVRQRRQRHVLRH